MGPRTLRSENLFIWMDTAASAPSVSSSCPRRAMSSPLVGPRASGPVRVMTTRAPASSRASRTSRATCRFSSLSFTPVAVPEAPASKPPWPASRITSHRGGVGNGSLFSETVTGRAQPSIKHKANKKSLFLTGSFYSWGLRLIPRSTGARIGGGPRRPDGTVSPRSPPRSFPDRTGREGGRRPRGPPRGRESGPQSP